MNTTGSKHLATRNPKQTNQPNETVMRTLTLDPPSAQEPEFILEATDVTGTIKLSTADLKRSTPASTAAEAIAARMNLPGNVPWMLRSDRTGGFLDEEDAIGEQLEPGERVVVTPKTHLGGPR